MRALLAGGLALFASCASGPDLELEWAYYDSSVRATLSDFVDVGNLNVLVEQYESQVAAAEAKRRVVAPGVHAQLGYLYSVLGDSAACERELVAEKALYPESAVFIDGLIARSKR